MSNLKKSKTIFTIGSNISRRTATMSYTWSCKSHWASLSC